MDGQRDSIKSVLMEYGVEVSRYTSFRAGTPKPDPDEYVERITALIAAGVPS